MYHSYTFRVIPLGRGRRTNALVQPQEAGCGERPRALHRRRSRAYALGRYRLVGLPEGVREAQGRWDGHRAGHGLRGAPLQDMAPEVPPEAPTPRLAQQQWRAGGFLMTSEEAVI